MAKARAQGEERQWEKVCTEMSRFGVFGYLLRKKDGRDIEASPFIYDLIGIDRESFTQHALNEMIHPDDREKVLEAERSLLAGRKSDFIEFRIICPDGREKQVRQTLEQVTEDGEEMVLSVWMDITPVKRMEAILETMNEAFIELDSQFRVCRINAQAEELWDKKRKDILGKNLLTLFPQIESRPTHLLLQRVHDNRKAERAEILSIINGRWMHLSVAPFNDGLIILSYDIHDRRTASEEMNANNRMLEEKNAELSFFSYIASHHLKGPLRKIYTAIEMILSQEAFKLSNNGKALFRRVQSSVQKMGLIADDLLSLVNINTDEFVLSEVDLNVVFKAAREQLSQTIEDKSADISASGLPVVNGSYDLLVQLFLNMISNAIKFSKPESTPVLSIRSEIVTGDLIPRPLSAENQDRKYYQVSFTDNGIGMDSAKADELFTMFLRAGKEYSGTGIGLAICRKIMEKHGGCIRAQNQGSGTEFSCYFPLATPDHRQPPRD